MSMLSGQCDRLRKAARTERALGHYNLDFLLMDAADTITELRDRLQESERHHRVDMEVIGEMVHPEVVEQLEAENANLRELVETLLADAMENVCSKSYWCDEKDWQVCNDKSCGSHLYVELTRDLGIEVGE